MHQAKSLNVTKGWFRIITSNPNYKLDQNGLSAISNISPPMNLHFKKLTLEPLEHWIQCKM